jgi:fatty acid desaturase
MKYLIENYPTQIDTVQLSNDFQQLKVKLKQQGVFNPDSLSYAIRTAWILPVYFLSWYALLMMPQFWLTTVLSIGLAISFVQSAAIAHEAGHNAITKNRNWAKFIGHFYMSFLMGSSFSSWSDKHNAHHRNVNSNDDPDIKAGIFSFNVEDATNSKGLRKLFTSYQHILIWPLTTLMGFSFKWGSIKYLYANPTKTRIDQIVLLAHIIFWLIIPAIIIGPKLAIIHYLLITWFAGFYLAFIFLTNHMGRPFASTLQVKSFTYRQIVCARNIRYSWFLTRVCNGLNSHIEHHLFCNISYTKLHLTTPFVRELCIKHGIPYHEVGLLQAYKDFFHFNQHMALLARGEVDLSVSARN